MDIENNKIENNQYEIKNEMFFIANLHSKTKAYIIGLIFLIIIFIIGIIYLKSKKN